MKSNDTNSFHAILFAQISKQTGVHSSVSSSPLTQAVPETYQLEVCQSFELFLLPLLAWQVSACYKM